MNVLAFERKLSGEVWSEAELDTLLAALNSALASEGGRGWEAGKTEKGDPQFHLLGPLPDQACEVEPLLIEGEEIFVAPRLAALA